MFVIVLTIKCTNYFVFLMANVIRCWNIWNSSVL